MTMKEIAKKIIASINPGNADISGVGDGTIKGAIRSMVLSLVDPMLATKEGFPADAKLTRDAIDELNSNIANVNIYVGEDSKLHFVDSEGADSVLPFSKTPSETAFSIGNIASNYTISGLEVGKTYILNMAGMYNSTSSNYISSGGTVIKTVSKISSEKYSGHNSILVTTMFVATSTSVVIGAMTV